MSRAKYLNWSWRRRRRLFFLEVIKDKNVTIPGGQELLQAHQFGTSVLLSATSPEKRLYKNHGFNGKGCKLEKHRVDILAISLLFCQKMRRNPSERLPKRLDEDHLFSSEFHLNFSEFKRSCARFHRSARLKLPTGKLPPDQMMRLELQNQTHDPSCAGRPLKRRLSGPPAARQRRDKSSSDEEVFKVSPAELRDAPLIPENRNKAVKVDADPQSEDPTRLHGPTGFGCSWLGRQGAPFFGRESRYLRLELLWFGRLRTREVLETEALLFGRRAS